MICSRAFPALLVSLLLGFTWLTASAQETKRAFDIPAGKAEATLKKFADQAGTQFFYSAEKVGGVRTNAVKGRLEPREALDLLVADTGLTVVQDAKTGALTVNRTSVPNAERVVRMEAATPKDQGKIEEGRVVLETYEVTGSRLPTLTGEHPMQPVVAFTSRDIERTGVATLGQLFQYIPQVSSYSTGEVNASVVSGGLLTGAAATSQISGSRTSANLRGGGALQTLLLVNGRRVAKSGQNDAQDGYDLGSIPLAAIDRVEVLLDGASAIYGSDAINGAINVILKKNYRGSEVRLSYGNTFKTDAAEKTVSFTSGFASGKLSGLISGSWSETNAQATTDRAITASADRRPYGGADQRTQGLIGNIPGGTGAISSTNGLPLPGLTVATVAIPTGSDGRNVTLAQYAAAGAPAAIYDPMVAYFSIGEGKKNGVSGHLAYAFSERLTVELDGRTSETWTESKYPFLSLKNFTIPAGYPGNPFGVPVRLSKIFFDEPFLRSGVVSRNSALTLTAHGKLAASWTYDVSADYTRLYQHATDNGSGVNFNTAALNAAIASTNQPVLLNDSTVGGSDALIKFVNPSTSQADLAQTWAYAAQANGTVWTLPTGDIRLVAGSEHRDERFAVPQLPNNSTIFVPNIDRQVTAVFGEMRIPLLSGAQQVPLIHKLDASLAYRLDDYSDFGQGHNPRYGLAWQPVKGLTLRASYGTGFNVPNLRDFAAFISDIGPLPGSLLGYTADPLRGNSALGDISVRTGGDPGIKPEKSESWTAGFTWDVPMIKGLSLGLNWYDNRYTDKITSSSGLPLDVLVQYFPYRLERGPKLPGDPSNWSGPITVIDWRSINASSARTSGYDISARWNRQTTWGEFDLGANLTGYLKNELVARAGVPPSANINKNSLPLQGMLSFFWSRGAFDTGLTAVYKGRFQRTPPSSIWTESNTRLDWQGSYDFGRSGWWKQHAGKWWQSALKDTRLSLTIYNALNTDPNLIPAGYFDLSIIDVRQQYYTLLLTRKF